MRTCCVHGPRFAQGSQAPWKHCRKRAAPLPWKPECCREAAGMAAASSSSSWLSSTQAGRGREASERIFQGVKPHLGSCLRMDYGKCAELTLLVQGLEPRAAGAQPSAWTRGTGQGLYLLPSSSELQLLGWRLLVCPACCVLSADSEPAPG